jgi:hypothetical protein
MIHPAELSDVPFGRAIPRCMLFVFTAALINFELYRDYKNLLWDVKHCEFQRTGREQKSTFGCVDVWKP